MNKKEILEITLNNLQNLEDINNKVLLGLEKLSNDTTKPSSLTRGYPLLTKREYDLLKNNVKKNNGRYKQIGYINSEIIINFKRIQNQINTSSLMISYLFLEIESQKRESLTKKYKLKRKLKDSLKLNKSYENEICYLKYELLRYKSKKD